MFSLSDLKNTKVYQEALEEGKQEGEKIGQQKAKVEAVPQLLALGLSVEQIASALNLTVEQVKKTAQK
ncbi:hypothetical protein AsFPU1_0548 [Aphanothece sacrum FPU1]|uniref:Rpn family recombination-promoting nuclease/putative transposase n=1 Tax=Aphanothece sacrum FPU1 TaxID=1920663 RepID=A0A401ID46_APHSA|nr:hypothetical protein AsFPU1_0548 [Aphanothece sacrum FPU1]GBF86545.1 hypothetical protein AsFPU3_3616 [Aphanothece sacrum FPU3]